MGVTQTTPADRQSPTAWSLMSNSFKRFHLWKCKTRWHSKPVKALETNRALGSLGSWHVCHVVVACSIFEVVFTEPLSCSLHCCNVAMTLLLSQCWFFKKNLFGQLCHKLCSAAIVIIEGLWGSSAFNDLDLTPYCLFSEKLPGIEAYRSELYMKWQCVTFENKHLLVTTGTLDHWA